MAQSPTPVPLRILEVPDNTTVVRLVAHSELAANVSRRIDSGGVNAERAWLAARTWVWTVQTQPWSAPIEVHRTKQLQDATLDVCHVNRAHAGRYRLHEELDNGTSTLLFDIELRVVALFETIFVRAGESLTLDAAPNADARVRWSHWCGGGPTLSDRQALYDASTPAFVTRDSTLRSQLDEYRRRAPSAGYTFSTVHGNKLVLHALETDDSGLYVAERDDDDDQKNEARVFAVYDVQVLGEASPVAAKREQQRNANVSVRAWVELAHQHTYALYTLHYRHRQLPLPQTLYVHVDDVSTDGLAESRSRVIRWYVVPAREPVVREWPASAVYLASDVQRAVGYLDQPLTASSAAGSLSVRIDTEHVLRALANAGSAHETVASIAERFSGGAFVLLAFEEHAVRGPYSRSATKLDAAEASRAAREPFRYVGRGDSKPYYDSGTWSADALDKSVPAVPLCIEQSDDDDDESTTVHDMIVKLRAQHKTVATLARPLGANTLWLRSFSHALLQDVTKAVRGGRLEVEESDRDARDQRLSSEYTHSAYATPGARARVRVLRSCVLVVFTPEPAPPPLSPPLPLKCGEWRALVSHTSSNQQRQRTPEQSALRNNYTLSELLRARRFARQDGSQLARAVEMRVHYEMAALRLLWFVAGTLTLNSGTRSAWYEAPHLMRVLVALEQAPDAHGVRRADTVGNTVLVHLPNASPMPATRLELGNLDVFEAETSDTPKSEQQQQQRFRLSVNGALVLVALCRSYAAELLARDAQWAQPSLGAHSWPQYNVRAMRVRWLERQDNADELLSMQQYAVSRVDGALCMPPPRPPAIAVVAAEQPTTAIVLSLDDVRKRVRAFWQEYEHPTVLMLPQGTVDAVPPLDDVGVWSGVTLESALARRPRDPRLTTLARRITSVALAWRLQRPAHDGIDAKRQQARSIAHDAYGSQMTQHDVALMRRNYEALTQMFKVYADSVERLHATMSAADALALLQRTDFAVRQADEALVRGLDAERVLIDARTTQADAADSEQSVRDLERAARAEAWRNGPARAAWQIYNAQAAPAFADVLERVTLEASNVALEQQRGALPNWSVDGTQRWRAVLAALAHQLDALRSSVMQAQRQHKDALTAAIDALARTSRQAAPDAFDSAAFDAARAAATHETTLATAEAERLRERLSATSTAYASTVETLRATNDEWRASATPQELTDRANDDIERLVRVLKEQRQRRAAVAPETQPPTPAVLSSDVPLAAEPVLPAPEGASELDRLSAASAISVYRNGIDDTIRARIRQIAAIAKRMLEERWPVTAPHWQRERKERWTRILVYMYLSAHTPNTLDWARLIGDALSANVATANAAHGHMWVRMTRDSMAAHWAMFLLDAARMQQHIADATFEYTAVALTHTLEANGVQGAGEIALAAHRRARATSQDFTPVPLKLQQRFARTLYHFYRRLNEVVGLGPSFLVVFDTHLPAFFVSGFDDGSGFDADHAMRSLDVFIERMATQSVYARLDRLREQRSERVAQLLLELAPLLRRLDAERIDRLATFKPLEGGAAASLARLPLAALLAGTAGVPADLARTDVRALWFQHLVSGSFAMAATAQAKLAMYAFAARQMQLSKPERAGDVWDFAIGNRDELVRRGWLPTGATIVEQRPVTALIVPLVRRDALGGDVRTLVDNADLLGAVRAALTQSKGETPRLSVDTFERLFVGTEALLGVRALPARPELSVEEYARQLEAQLVDERTLIDTGYRLLKFDGMRLLIEALCVDRPLALLVPAAAAADRSTFGGLVTYSPTLAYRPSSLFARLAVEATEALPLARFTGPPIVPVAAHNSHNLVATLQRLAGGTDNRRFAASLNALFGTDGDPGRQRMVFAAGDYSTPFALINRTAPSSTEAQTQLYLGEPGNRADAWLCERTLMLDWFDAIMHMIDPNGATQQLRIDTLPLALPITPEQFFANPDQVPQLPALPLPDVIGQRSEFLQLQRELQPVLEALTTMRIKDELPSTLETLLQSSSLYKESRLERELPRLRTEKTRLLALVERARAFREAEWQLDTRNRELASQIADAHVKAKYKAAYDQRLVLHTYAESAFDLALSKLAAENERLSALVDVATVFARTLATEAQQMRDALETLDRARIHARGADAQTQPSNPIDAANIDAYERDLANRRARLQEAAGEATRMHDEARTLEQLIQDALRQLGAVAVRTRDTTWPDTTKLNESEATQLLKRMRVERNRLQHLLEYEEPTRDILNAVAGFSLQLDESRNDMV